MILVASEEEPTNTSMTEEEDEDEELESSEQRDYPNDDPLLEEEMSYNTESLKTISVEEIKGTRT